jgi:hypothetical protein
MKITIEEKQYRQYERKLKMAKFFESYCSIGSYPLFIVWQGEAYCADCVNDNIRSDIHDENHEDDCEWLDNQELTPAINYEDPSLYCVQCSERIESAYAEPDSEEDSEEEDSEEDSEEEDSEDPLYSRDLSKDWQNHI